MGKIRENEGCKIAKPVVEYITEGGDILGKEYLWNNGETYTMWFCNNTISTRRVAIN